MHSAYNFAIYKNERRLRERRPNRKVSIKCPVSEGHETTAYWWARDIAVELCEKRYGKGRGYVSVWPEWAGMCATGTIASEEFDDGYAAVRIQGREVEAARRRYKAWDKRNPGKRDAERRRHGLV